MSSVFVIQNQSGQFLSRQKEWVAKTDINVLYKTPHRDLAINELVEVTSKDTEVRAKVVEAETTPKGLPLVADLPPLEFPKIELPEDLTAPPASGEHEGTEPARETTATAVAAEPEPAATVEPKPATAKRPFPQLKPLAETESPSEEL